MRVSVAAALFLLGCARADSAPLVQYLPGAAETAGLNGARYSSTLWLANLGAAPANISIGLIPSGGVASPAAALRTVAPGETQAIAHVLPTLFGSSFMAGTLILTGDTMLLSRMETANVATPAATYGVSLDPVPDSAALLVGQVGHAAWLSVSADPTSGFRTNVSTTLLDPDSSVVIEVYDDRGTLRGSTSVSAGQPQSFQSPVASLVGPGGLPAGRALFRVTAGRAIGYTVLNDNVTGDGIISRAERLAAGPADLLLDGVALAPGRNGTRWSTDVRLLNPGTAPVPVTLTTLGIAPAPSALTRSVPAGGLLELDDVLGPEGFGLPDGTAGALEVRSPSPLLAAARTRTSDPAGSGGTFSGSQAAVPYPWGLVSPPYMGFFAGLDQSGTVPGFRTNLALLGGPSGSAGSLVLRDAAGRRLASAPWTLRAGEWRQLGLDAWFPGVAIPSGARVDVGIDSGSAHAYASRIDNGSGDPAILPIATLAGDVDRRFFGLSINKQSSPWPSFSPFGAWRALGSAIKWADLEMCDGGGDSTNPCYRWDSFDAWLAKAQGGGADVLFTLYATPSWASSRGARCKGAGNPDAGCTGPADTACAFQAQNGPGICDPPDDIDATPGSGKADGTNRHFRDFVTALLAHAGPGTIHYWEIWNEPNISTEWNNAVGTYAHLVRMARDTREIVKATDPYALFTTPAVANTTTAAANWLEPYLKAGGADAADVIAFHGYVGPTPCPASCPIPENEAALLTNLKAVLIRNGQEGKPLFDTEVSWGEKSNVTDWAYRSAFAGRMYLLSAASGVDRLYWYGLDFAISSTGGSGEFWAPQGNPDGCVVPQDGGEVCPAGIAVQQVYQWMAGAAFDAPCATAGTTWTCSLTRPNGTRALAAWDTGSGPASVPAPSGAVRVRALDGTVTPVAGPSGSPVPVGPSPILIEAPGN